jgi:hypothetical protein
MSGELVRKPEALVQHSPSKLELVEAILMLQSTAYVVIERLQKATRQEPTNPILEKQRQELLKKTEPELQNLLATIKHEKDVARRAEAAAKEAARFYNRRATNAEYEYWAKAEYWTPDEAMALLMGISPELMTHAAVEREVARLTPIFGSKPSQLPYVLDLYFQVRKLAERAGAMKGPKIHPASALIWAIRSGAIAPPAELIRIFERRAEQLRPQPLHAAPPAQPASMSEKTQAAAPSVMHSTKGARRDVLAPVIEAAQTSCRNAWDHAEVWGRLTIMAEKKEPPLLGATEDGLQYLRDGVAATLSRDALKKRLDRSAANRR